MTQVKVTYDALKAASQALMDDYYFKHMVEPETPMKDELDAIVESIIQTVLKKNADYSDAWQRYGMFTGLIRLNDKLLRMQTLSDGHPALVADEGIEDTLVDIMGYGLLLKVWLDGQEEPEIVSDPNAIGKLLRGEQLHLPLITEEEQRLKAIASEEGIDHRLYEDEIKWKSLYRDGIQYADYGAGHGLLIRKEVQWRTAIDGRHFIYETDLDIEWEPKPSNQQE